MIKTDSSEIESKLFVLLQASDHIATSYAELRDGGANAKVRMSPFLFMVCVCCHCLILVIYSLVEVHFQLQQGHWKQ